jgi:hypothetical protein
VGQRRRLDGPWADNEDFPGRRKFDNPTDWLALIAFFALCIAGALIALYVTGQL